MRESNRGRWREAVAGGRVLFGQLRMVVAHPMFAVLCGSTGRYSSCRYLAGCMQKIRFDSSSAFFTIPSLY